MRRALPSIVLAVVLATSCTASRPLTLTSGATPARWHASQRIAAYVTRDRQRHAFDGYVEIRGDSLRFVQPALRSRGLERDRPEVVVMVARDSVAAVEAVYVDVPRSVALGVGLGALLGAVALLGVALSFRDEPLL